MFVNTGNDDFYRKLSQIPFLDKEEELKLIHKAHAGDKKARDAIIFHNLKLLPFLIKSCPYNARFEENDLFQEGVLAMLRAIETFDTAKDIKFKTYATIKIRKYINNYIEKNHFALKVPLYLKEVFRKIQKIEKKYLEEHNYQYPTIKYMANKLNMPEITISKCLELYGSGNTDFSNFQEDSYEGDM
jgi:DNA-directed RNA polymerase sigma subunit (sigma70/sigma32)